MSYQSLYQALSDSTKQVVEFNGRWFITIGHPGFNSRTNNGQGYASEDAARRAMAKYWKR